MARRLALIIGNSQYDDASLSRLTAPSADVKAFADVLRAPDVCKFDEVIPLVDEGCAAVRKAIARFYDLRKRDDLLLLYFSGHGVKDENGHLYLAVRDTESSLLAGSAIEASFITGRMERSASKRLVLILDCCHSGAFAAGTKAVQGGSVGTATAFQGMGRVVLTATDATQYAWDGNRVLGDAQTSLFTRFMIEGLKTGAADHDDDGVITVDELYEYVYEKVLDATPTQTPGKWAWLKGQIVLVDNAGARRIARAAEHLAAARAAIERKQFAAALESLRQVSELNPAAEGLADLTQRATEGLAAAEEAQRLRTEIAQKNDEARRQLAHHNFWTARMLVEDSLRRDPSNADCKALLEEIRHGERLAHVDPAPKEEKGKPRKLRDRLVSGAAATAAAAVLVTGVYKFGARSVSPTPPVVALPPEGLERQERREGREGQVEQVREVGPRAEPSRVPETPAVVPAAANHAAEVSAAVRQARQQFARGDREAALKTVGSALALDANNQAAQTVLIEIVKDAQHRAAQAADAATRAGAPMTATDVRAAQQVQGDARRLGRAGDYDAAARKYWEAAELFGRAARASQTTLAAAGDRTSTGQAAPESHRAPAEVAAAAPEPKLHAPPPPTVAPSAPAPSTPAPTEAATNATTDTASVLDVMRRYQAAYNKLDAAEIVRIVPSLAVAQLERSFANLRSYQIDLANPHVSVDGNVAEVTCVRNVLVRPRVGNAQNVSAKTTFRLRRNGASWIIDKVEDR